MMLNFIEVKSDNFSFEAAFSETESEETTIFTVQSFFS